MVYCSAVNCKSNFKPPCSNRRKEDIYISFYGLPHDHDFKRKWISAIKRATLPKEESVKVCHLHFDENCFERDRKVYLIGKNFVGKK